jgi:hypothetical protein
VTDQTEREKLRLVGWAALLLLVGLEALVTGWALLALFGVAPAPGQATTIGDQASIAVAGGTLILATVTVVLALLTRRSLTLGAAELKAAEDSVKAVNEQTGKLADQVTATQGQAKVARETLEASWRPFLVDVPYGFANRGSARGGVGDAAVIDVWKNDNGSQEADVPLRNIGSGPAIIHRAEVSVNQLHERASRWSPAIVAPGEVVRLRFLVATGTATRNALIDALKKLEPCVITVFYADQGTGKWRSRVYLHRLPEEGPVYTVDFVELYVGDENTPFATSSAAQ